MIGKVISTKKSFGSCFIDYEMIKIKKGTISDSDIVEDNKMEDNNENNNGKIKMLESSETYEN